MAQQPSPSVGPARKKRATLRYTQGGSGEVRSTLFGRTNPYPKLTLVRPEELIAATVLSRERA